MIKAISLCTAAYRQEEDSCIGETATRTMFYKCLLGGSIRVHGVLVATSAETFDTVAQEPETHGGGMGGKLGTGRLCKLYTSIVRLWRRGVSQSIIPQIDCDRPTRKMMLEGEDKRGR